MPAAALVRPADDTSTASVLLDVAERLFAERGIASVSLRQIVLEGGQGNLSAAHYHFGSRDALIRALVERRLRTLDALRHARRRPPRSSRSPRRWSARHGVRTTRACSRRRSSRRG